MGYRQHQDPRLAAFINAKSRHDRAGAIFLAFVTAFEVFAVPKVAVPDDETGNRRGERHNRSLQLGVKMREFIGDFGLAHGLDPLFGEFRRQTDLTIATF